MGMLTKEDLNQIGQLFDQKFDQKFDAAFDRKFDAAFDRKFDAAFDRKFDAAFDRKFDVVFDRKFDTVKTDLVVALGDVIEQNITPQFDDVRTEMREGFDRLERRIDRVDGKVNTLTNVLQEKNIITDADKRVVLS